VFLVMRPFLSALLWGTILTISTWPLRVRLTRASSSKSD
jgi:predicted PurR-regulated permease PerM